MLVTGTERFVLQNLTFTNECIPCGRRSTPMPNGTLTYPLRATRIAGELNIAVTP